MRRLGGWAFGGGVVLALAGSLYAQVVPAAGPAPAAVSASWEPCGWGGGGWFWATVFHPARNGVIYMGLDVGGVAKTTDHGMHWRITNAGLTNYAVYSLAVDRSNPETLYAGTEGGLHRSTDGGEHWELLPKTGPKELRITAERGKSVRAIAVDPTNGNNLYAASPGGKVYRSVDAGKTWIVAYESKAAKPGTVYAVAVSAKEPSMVVAATEDSGLVLSEDAGKTWRTLNTPKQASSAVFAETDPQIMYGSFFKEGIWKSVDKGATWTRVSEGLGAQDSIREVAVSPASALDVYAIGSGVFISSDGGKSWKSSHVMAVDLEGNPTRHYNGENKTTNIVNPMNVAVNRLNPKELFISADWRPAWSGDGGQAWSERERGADISCITDIRFSNGRAYATAMDEGLLVSEDNGKRWRQLWPKTYIADLSGHAWRVAVNNIGGVDHIVSTFSPWNISPKVNLVVVSDDGGKTYQVVKSGLPDYELKVNTMWERGYMRALATDPANPRIVYAGVDGDAEPGKSGGGLFKSEDGGHSWKQLANQPGGRRMFNGLAVDPTNSNRIFWGASASNAGVWRSEDGGNSWSNVFTKEPMVWNLLVTTKGTIYAAGANLWKSSDHGESWSQLTKFASDGAVVGLEADPRNDQTVWISTGAWGHSLTGIYKTNDGGASWQEITGNIPYTKPLVLRFNPATNELWAGWVGLYKIKQ